MSLISASMVWPVSCSGFFFALSPSSPFMPSLKDGPRPPRSLPMLRNFGSENQQDDRQQNQPMCNASESHENLNLAAGFNPQAIQHEPRRINVRA